jgi:hypothetical protein
LTAIRRTSRTGSGGLRALESGGLPFDLAQAKLLLLVDRASGGMLGVTLFESEDAMRKGDETMNAGKVAVWVSGATQPTMAAGQLLTIASDGSISVGGYTPPTRA